MYAHCLSGVSIRTVLVASTLVFACTQALKLLIVTGMLPECKTSDQCTWFEWLINPLNFSYFLSCAYALANSIHRMPIMVLACKLCPKDVEATFYSFQLAVINLGYLISY